ncbi:MAG: hypothetical protein RIQ79_1671 [Verrucomicrobiota bacterium]|jgi:hypothetical protein
MDITDALGRTINAEVISVEADTVKIRRADGMEFKLDLKTLRAEDQAKIKAWVETAAKSATPSGGDAEKTDPKSAALELKRVPDRKNISLSASRYKADSVTISKWEGYSHRHEQWGYGFQVSNRHLYTLEKVRLEYNLYARTFADSSTPALVSGFFDFAPIGPNRSLNMKTKTAEVCKQKGDYMYNTGGEVRGIWARLYVDGVLMQEYVSPDSIKTEFEWVTPNPDKNR